MERDWLKREQYGKESSRESSRRIRLLRPFGPVALPTGSIFRIDSTSSAVRTMLLSSDSILVGRIAGSGAFRSSRSDWL